ncbi:MAG: 3-phosphoshikimate 1-carboxyvinyltransferase [Firmicutes bacterium]|nr:3-phosphoshikimate 1-carboxyvinyltransferase [Bacillota bacterium]
MLAKHAAKEIIVDGPVNICGQPFVPGDKSISHRALIFSFLTGKQSLVSNLNTGRDCLHTLLALHALGGNYSWQGAELLTSSPRTGWQKRKCQIYAGNSGTTARLMMGLGAHFTNGSLHIIGDKSLSQRPMARVGDYLQTMGMHVNYLNNYGQLPLVIAPGQPQPATHKLTVPSAQVKSAILLAGLAVDGETEIIQKEQTRDHTERLLKLMGADLKTREPSITLQGRRNLNFPAKYTVPGDISAAAFWLACAAAGGQITLTGVGINPTRTGILKLLEAMGATIQYSNARCLHGEPVADLIIGESELRGIDVPPEVIPFCIDELPILAALAACARGRTVVRGARELRFKESDRLAGILTLMKRFGVDCEQVEDGLVIWGGRRFRPANFYSEDHRLLMAAALLASRADGQSRIGPVRWLDVSYPGFGRQLSLLATGNVCLA